MRTFRSFFIQQFSKLSLRFWLCLGGVCLLLGCGWIWIGKGLLGLFTGLSGVCLVFFTGKGRVIGLVFGLCYDVLSTFLIVLKDYRLWGDVSLNLFYAFVAIYGIFTWKHPAQSFHVKILTWTQRLVAIGVWGIGTLLALLFLDSIKSSFVYAESLITAGCFLAFCLQVKRYVEAYILFTLCNCISVGIWFCIFSTTPESIVQLLSSCIFLCVGSYYGWEWMKKAKSISISH